jgi:hypothetical protein
MDGDGIPDLTEYNSLTGEISVRSGSGDGRFGASVAQPVSWSESASPYPTTEYTHVVDISGDGRADLVFETGLSLKIFVNAEGYFRFLGILPNLRFGGFTPPVGTPDNPHVRLKFADVLGTGSTNIVFVTDGTLESVAYECADWLDKEGSLGFVPAGLLTDIYNGVGGHKKIVSSMSTKLLADRSFTTPLPVAVPLVIKEVAETKLPKDLQVPEGTNHEYFNPIFDGWRRRLIGFERIKDLRTRSSRMVPINRYLQRASPTTVVGASSEPTIGWVNRSFASFMSRSRKPLTMPKTISQVARTQIRRRASSATRMVGSHRRLRPSKTKRDRATHYELRTSTLQEAKWRVFRQPTPPIRKKISQGGCVTTRSAAS